MIGRSLRVPGPGRDDAARVDAIATELEQALRESEETVRRALEIEGARLWSEDASTEQIIDFLRGLEFQAAMMRQGQEAVAQHGPDLIGNSLALLQGLSTAVLVLRQMKDVVAATAPPAKERPRWPSNEFLFWPRVLLFLGFLAVAVLAQTNTMIGAALRGFSRFVLP